YYIGFDLWSLVGSQSGAGYLMETTEAGPALTDIGQWSMDPAPHWDYTSNAPFDHAGRLAMNVWFEPAPPAPTITIDNQPTYSRLVVTSNTSGGLNDIDWSTFGYFLDGVDFTSAYLSLLGTPYMTPTVTPNRLEILFNFGLPMYRHSARICATAAAGGRCGTSP